MTKAFLPKLLGLVAIFAGLLSGPAAAERRVALVIGNGGYVHATSLPNPPNDARDIAKALTQTGFQVILGVDVDKRGFEAAVREFARAVGTADVALLFYAGHGLQVAGINYMLPIDARLEDERQLDFEAVRVDLVLRQMELDRESRTSLVFLDACRDNPLARNLARSMGTRSAALGRGLAQVQSGVGSFLAYATQPGNVALDGQGRNSPFTAALKRHMLTPGRNLNAVMIDVRREVLAATDGRQVPWDSSALTGDFYFVGGTPTGQSRAEGAPARPPVAAPKSSASAALLPSPEGLPVKSADGCIALGRTLASPIRISRSSSFCQEGGVSSARVIRIVDTAVVFAVDNGREFTCRNGALCQFDWPVAPVFTVRVTGDEGRGIEPVAELLPRPR